MKPCRVLGRLVTLGALPLVAALLRGADAGLLIGVPDTPPTSVRADGGLAEAWGAVRLALVAAAGGTEEAAVVRQARAQSATPVVLTESADAGVALTVTAFRAPAWPTGFDVLAAELHNTADRRRLATLHLVLPDGVAASGNAVRLGGRAVIALAPPPPVWRATGCLTDAASLPGWGRPSVPCHPAFRNIRAGLGGIPIVYQFVLAAPGESRALVLGFCESHWAEPGQRPLQIQVEGAPERRLDAVAEWGQHRPGCLRFDARDTDNDARIDVRILPVPGAPDRNPILNAIWLFPAGAAPEPQEILAGRADSQALCVVDVGGPGDGPITTAGKVEFPGGRPTYRVDLDPGARQTLAFLVASGDGSVPAWPETTWTLRSLRQAADDVWAGCLGLGRRDLAPLGDAAWECRAAVADILMSRAQADDFYLALGEPGSLAANAVSGAAAARMVQALDRLGFGREAERMLRVYWDRPPPSALARCAPRDDGHWEDATAALCPHAQILLALARHAAVGRDPAWLARAYPAIRAGADWIRTQRAAGSLPEADQPWLALALTAAAEAATLAGKPDDAAWMRQDAVALGAAAAEDAAYAGLGRCVDAANRILALTASAAAPVSANTP